MLKGAVTAAVLTCCALTSCSPYVSKTEITHVTSGIGSVSSSVSDGRAQLATDAETVREASWRDKRLPVSVSPGCFTDTATGTPPAFVPCGLSSARGFALSDVAATETNIDLVMPIVNGLSGYADALLAVSNAGDQDAFNMASTSLSDAVGTAVDAIAKVDPSAGSASSGASAAASLLTSISGFFLESKRYSALKAGILAMEPRMSSISSVLEVGLEDIKQKRMIIIQSAMNGDAAKQLASGAAARWPQTKYDAELASLSVSATAYSEIRASDPKKVLRDMTDAHTQLADALRANKGQLEAVTNAAIAFAKSADALRKALAVPANPKQ